MRKAREKTNVSFCVFHNGCDPLEADATIIHHEMQNQLGLTPALPEKADILIFMGCTFSRQKEMEFEEGLAKICNASNGQFVIASGCYLKETLSFSNLRYCRKHKVKELVSESFGLSERQPVLDSRPSGIENGIVLISEGCYGRCSFCSVKNVRGNHRSRLLDEILNDINVMSIENESIVVKLAGQDIGAYGRDKGYTLWDLLSAILEGFPKLRIELGPLGPEWLVQSDEKDLSLLAHRNIEGNLHIPLQSGSDNVLELMRRNYSYQEFQALFEKLGHVGVKNISTDIMAGFPGETATDHEKNLDFFNTHELAFAQIFMYEPRPNTEASSWEILTRSIRLERTIELIAEYLQALSVFKQMDLEKLVLNSNEMPFNTNITFEEEINNGS